MRMMMRMLLLMTDCGGESLRDEVVVRLWHFPLIHFWQPLVTEKRAQFTQRSLHEQKTRPKDSPNRVVLQIDLFCKELHDTAEKTV